MTSTTVVHSSPSLVLPPSSLLNAMHPKSQENKRELASQSRGPVIGLLTAGKAAIAAGDRMAASQNLIEATKV